METTPIILVDGLKEFDRQGLARTIAQRLDYEYHCGLPMSAPGFVIQMRAALERRSGVVIERSWLSDQVFYAITKQRRMTNAEHNMLTTMALSRSVVSVVADGNLQNFLVGYGMKVSPTIPMIDTAIAVYNEWFQVATSFPSYRVNFFEFLESPQQHLKQLENYVHRYHNTGPGIGAFYKGTTLVVGEQHGPTVQPYTVNLNMPFVSMSGTGCSDWLHTQLVNAKIKPHRLYWINAYDHAGNETSARFVKDFQPKSIIALGERALQWCDRHKLPAIKIPHPQYWKRFHYSEAYPLIRLIA